MDELRVRHASKGADLPRSIFGGFLPPNGARRHFTCRTRDKREFARNVRAAVPKNTSRRPRPSPEELSSLPPKSFSAEDPRIRKAGA
jgi:hypothetical protein